MNENDDYIIEIKNGKRNTYFKRDELREKGFDFVSKRKAWVKILCEKDTLELEKYAKRNGFKVRFYPKSMKRSHAYREQYFAAHQPDILGRYFCTYCGKLIKPKDVQVDHMVSIALVQKNHWMQKYVSDINDSKNLVASCRRCNLKKRVERRIMDIERAHWPIQNLLVYGICRIYLECNFDYFKILRGVLM